MTRVYMGINIDDSRDDLLTEPAKDLIKNFYTRSGETIHATLARACVAWADDMHHAQRLYDANSMLHFMWSSPMLSNAPELKPEIWKIGMINQSLPIWEHEEDFNHNGSQNISCFESNTPVITDKGLKRIADIQIGDMVLTHEGVFKPVLNTKASQSTDCYELEFQGERFVVTGNHLILTEDHGWVRVDELDSTIHVIRHIPQTV